MSSFTHARFHSRLKLEKGIKILSVADERCQVQQVNAPRVGTTCPKSGSKFNDTVVTSRRRLICI